ncbi:serine/threonine protein kinase [Lipingzhangella halophila]|uniref:Serine/threonine protein kinase n=1 Tax=Lipingzhangella halophila TaxID=1783352 RepID=A0A7W7RD53_9ACTN|nr:serine/threonine-protein kinase [Lipingzhangella halophila]MBB4929830.1 serine/threonine protein kinase [Lipingzhangella halophila]
MKARGKRRLDALLPSDPRTVGGYPLVGRVGSGAMGTVYAATRRQGAGYVAVKVIHPDHAAKPDVRERFAHEARLLARVNSPCVARFVQADVEAELPWMVTEYVPGPTVRHHVERHGPLRDAMLRALAVGAAEALRGIHDAGIVHRDLKPSNVVMAPTGPKLLDFGIAHPTTVEDATRWMRVRRLRRRLRTLHLPSSPALTDTDDTPGAPADRMGTPGWSSPEQYRGHPATSSSDIFLWGALVAFAAAAHDPFGHGHPKELARRVLREEPDLDRLPPDLETLVLAAMAKDPADRPDATELLRRTLALGQAPNETSAGERRRAVQRALERDWTGVAVRLPQPPREHRWFRSA